VGLYLLYIKSLSRWWRVWWWWL